MCSLPPLEQELFIRRQGAYLGIIHHPSTYGAEVYAGSSYGKMGLGNRILNNHRNAAHRRGIPQKILYQAMDRAGSTTNFLRLATYPPKTVTAQILLTEAVSASLFGTVQNKVYLDSRHPSLPAANNIVGLNRSDPVQAWEEGLPTFGIDATLFRCLRVLDNCRRSGPFHLAAHLRKGIVDSIYFVV